MAWQNNRQQQQARPADDVEELNISAVEKVLIEGDLSRLSAQERIQYYQTVCESLGLNPLTKPFEYIELDGKNGVKALKLYASRNCGDQLRKKYEINTTIVERRNENGVYSVIARAEMPSGRSDESIGAVAFAQPGGKYIDTGQKWPDGNPKTKFQPDGTLTPLAPLEAANAMMKAETKAKRRVALSICGLSMLDAAEVEDIAEARARHMGVVFDEPEANNGVDPGDHPQTASYDLRPKALAAPATDNVITLPKQEKQAEPVTVNQQQKQEPAQQVKQEPAPQQKQAETKPAPTAATQPAEQKKPEAAPAEKYDDGLDAIAANDVETPHQVIARRNKEAMARVIAIAGEQGVTVGHVGLFINTLKGEIKTYPEAERADTLHAAINELVASLTAGGDAAKAAFVKDGKKYAEKLRKAAEKEQAKDQAKAPAAPTAPAPAEAENGDPFTVTFGWQGELLQLAHAAKGNRAMGGFIGLLKANGFGEMDHSNATAALKLFRLSPDVLLVIKQGRSTPVQLLERYEETLEMLGDPEAALAELTLTKGAQ